MINISDLVSDQACFEKVRYLRWKHGVYCPNCRSKHVKKNGSHRSQPERRQYHCLDCNVYFNDLTDTIFENHHIGLKKWILCSYFMGLNLSNHQISEELDLDKDTVQMMCELLREGIVKKKKRFS